MHQSRWFVQNMIILLLHKGIDNNFSAGSRGRSSFLRCRLIGLDRILIQYRTTKIVIQYGLVLSVCVNLGFTISINIPRWCGTKWKLKSSHAKSTMLILFLAGGSCVFKDIIFLKYKSYRIKIKIYIFYVDLIK